MSPVPAHTEEARTGEGDNNDDRHKAMRTINVEVPEEVYWHVRTCATESRLPMKEFMARFCREAKPISDRMER